MREAYPCFDIMLFQTLKPPVAMKICYMQKGVLFYRFSFFVINCRIGYFWIDNTCIYTSCSCKEKRMIDDLFRINTTAFVYSVDFTIIRNHWWRIHVSILSCSKHLQLVSLRLTGAVLSVPKLLPWLLSPLYSVIVIGFPIGWRWQGFAGVLVWRTLTLITLEVNTTTP